MILNKEKKNNVWKTYAFNHWSFKKIYSLTKNAHACFDWTESSKSKRGLNDFQRNFINPQDLNNVKNLRATWVNENAEKSNISKKKRKKGE